MYKLSLWSHAIKDTEETVTTMVLCCNFLMVYQKTTVTRILCRNVLLWSHAIRYTQETSATNILCCNVVDGLVQ